MPRFATPQKAFDAGDLPPACDIARRLHG